MANASKATKTITATPGSCASFILEPGVLFQRKTNLPANWNKIRIGMMVSLTNLASANGTPTSEGRTTGISTILQSLIIGMSNGVGLPGTAGVKFIGARSAYTSENSYGCSVSLDSAVWRIQERASGGGGAYQTMRAMWSNGASLATPQGFIHYFECGDPSALASCMFGMVWEFELQTNGNFILKYVANTGLSNLGDPSDNTLMRLIGTASLTAASTVASGWWSASVANDCQYLTIRAPFLLNRLRIHNLMILDFSSY